MDKNGKFKVIIKKEVEVTVKDLANIMITAFEGGINYWCDSVEADKPPLLRTFEKNDFFNAYGLYLANGGKFTVTSDDGDYTGTFGVEEILKAIETYIKNGFAYSADIVTTDNNKFVMDCGMVDSTVADGIIQLASFGEWIFG